MIGNSLLKKIWNLAPQPLRVLYINTLMARKFGELSRKPRSGPIYIAGAFRSNSGMGEGARLYAREMAAQGSPHFCLDLTREMRMAPEISYSGKLLDPGDLEGKAGGLLILHANPPQFQLALLSLPAAFLQTVHIRPYWAWELETLPPVWLQALPYADSIESPSHFCRRAFAAAAAIPCAARPHPVPAPEKQKSRFCKDGVLRCLSIFDAGSSFERKNPQAALEAFRKAFREGEAELVFKVSHPCADKPAYKNFREQCARVPGVGIIEETLSEARLSELYLENDVYISLHRSEGFGLTIREALAHGLYAVATGWSGNVDFMRGDKSRLVPYRLSEKRWRKGPMAGLNGRWAEADINACASILRQLREELA